ncbi:MAG: hypothetical protein ABSD48_08675 [Armatimonadota bacterium]|jgi:hypothetical protein
MSLTAPCCILTAMAGLLIGLGPSQTQQIQQRLQKGDAFQFTVDAEKVVRPANRRVMGISFFNLWDYVPIYDGRSGEWVLRESASEAIRSLRVPFSRTYWMDKDRRSGKPAWDLHGSIDRAAETCRRFGIDQEDFVLEPESQRRSESMSPEEWVDAVRYAQSKGYTFRYWEICNEPWGMGGPDDDPWTADDYVAHVKAVYQAVKAQRPDLKVGASAGVGPFNVFGGTQAYDPILAKAAGFYDFIAPHFYCHLKNLDQIPFERITFEGNAWVLHSYVMKTRELLETYNPDRRVEILDTEWGMHGYNHGEGVRADDSNRNGNIAGTLHRTIRMIYYLNEGLVDAAGQWCILTPVDRPGFAIVTINDDREFLLYYLNYYLGRYVSDEVVDITGTCPYYEKRGVASDWGWNGQATYDVSMPQAPTIVTRSKDGKHLYLVVANGTASESLPCTVDLKGFRAATAEAKRLTQDSIDAPALVDKGSDVIGSLAVRVMDGGRGIEFESAPHSVSFISLTAETEQ